MSEKILTGEVSKVDRSIDRLKTCPLLLRVFCNKARHHLAKEYEDGHTPENELQIYTWMDATLGELTKLIQEVNTDARRRGTQFSFSIVQADSTHNRYYLTDIGITENGPRRGDDQIQLAKTRFRVGDYLDVAIMQKRQEQPAANPRRDRPLQQSSEDNNKRRSGPANERNGSGPVRSAPRNDHRDRPY
ncbi:unnamed protein product [Rotaria socialis]|uniref:18 kDa Sin3-associated polypeptide n=1 Tax=Rotaria socialis TaxID=392032 RepID=A0A817U2V7_9BILA|nr:unnamed protein product [Rotaria socialis]CAF3329700.1 unnamed protein product [Rotaria socialis]CAF3399107.1 unnamed protein product [Rotaria socialis]CAF3512621.1 unnamed protein product [Rotaria socialis]CAF3689470.1 unnamed protein product [Rotaria socialis]